MYHPLFTICNTNKPSLSTAARKERGMEQLGCLVVPHSPKADLNYKFDLKFEIEVSHC